MASIQHTDLRSVYHFNSILLRGPQTVSGSTDEVVHCGFENGLNWIPHGAETPQRPSLEMLMVRVTAPLGSSWTLLGSAERPERRTKASKHRVATPAKDRSNLFPLSIVFYRVLHSMESTAQHGVYSVLVLGSAVKEPPVLYRPVTL